MAKKTALGLILGCSVLLGTYRTVLSHCEIPCGIYGDNTRFDLLYENIATVEKSMKQIIALPKEDEINVNQVVRWVNNKEEHANNIQHIVTQYFMTQRVKPKSPEDGAAHEKYVKQLTLLHQLLVTAMKSKQTTDLNHIAQMRKLVGEFAEAYLSKADLEHLRQHHSGQ